MELVISEGAKSFLDVEGRTPLCVLRQVTAWAILGAYSCLVVTRARCNCWLFMLVQSRVLKHGVHFFQHPRKFHCLRRHQRKVGHHFTFEVLSGGIKGGLVGLVRRSASNESPDLWIDSFFDWGCPTVGLHFHCSLFLLTQTNCHGRGAFIISQHCRCSLAHHF